MLRFFRTLAKRVIGLVRKPKPHPIDENPHEFFRELLGGGSMLKGGKR